MSENRDFGKRANELRAKMAAAHASIAKAHAEIAELTKQLRADSQELRRLERSIVRQQLPATELPSATERTKNPNRRDVADQALHLISKAGRPLRRRELFERLTAAGVTINGKDPEMVLGTMLYRDDRIVRLRNHGYWPKAVPYDPAFYIPEHEAVIGATIPADQPDHG